MWWLSWFALMEAPHELTLSVCCALLSLLKLLLLQLWYIVPPARHQEFISKLQQLMGLPDLATAAGLTAVKTLLPLLPAAAIRELGVRRLLQRPGDIILTCPVSCLAAVS
jgi:hypothetical protein